MEFPAAMGTCSFPLSQGDRLSDALSTTSSPSIIRFGEAPSACSHSIRISRTDGLNSTHSGRDISRLSASVSMMSRQFPNKVCFRPCFIGWLSDFLIFGCSSHARWHIHEVMLAVERLYVHFLGAGCGYNQDNFGSPQIKERVLNCYCKSMTERRVILIHVWPQPCSIGGLAILSHFSSPVALFLRSHMFMRWWVPKHATFFSKGILYGIKILLHMARRASSVRFNFGAWEVVYVYTHGNYMLASVSQYIN